MSKKTKMKKSSPVVAVSDFVVDLLESILSADDLDHVRTALDENKKALTKLLKSTAPKDSSQKKLKDPNAPKRGKSSYIFYCIDNREKVKEANPDMSAKEIIRELGRVWREDTSDKVKARYGKKAVADKARYEKDMESYVPPPEILLQKKSARTGPKRGLTAYIYFCKEHRPIIKEESPELSTKEITSALGKKWKTLTDKKKKPFAKLAKKDKERYESENAAWVNGDSVAVEEKVIVAKKASKKASKKKVTLKKEKKTRKKSGYVVFCQEQRPLLKADNESLSAKEVTKELGKAWKSLSPEEQAAYSA
jgi:hypothetical protein